jgi:hypothetical protein
VIVGLALMLGEKGKAEHQVKVRNLVRGGCQPLAVIWVDKDEDARRVCWIVNMVGIDRGEVELMATETRVAPGIRRRSSGSYEARLGDRYLGSFKTLAEAEAARRAAKARAREKKPQVEPR